jgi:hypothetical protein
MHPEKLKNVLALPATERYGYLIRTVADSEEIWLIQDEGKTLTVGDAQDVALPVFPEKEFAEMLLSDDWQNCDVSCISIYEFLDGLDDLQKQQIKLAGFPNSNLNAVMVSAEEMKDHLLYEYSSTSKGMSFLILNSN